MKALPLIAMIAIGCGRPPGGGPAAPDAGDGGGDGDGGGGGDGGGLFTNLIEASATYQGTGGGFLGSSNSGSNCNSQQNAYGYLPAGAGSAPVFIYLAGTAANYRGADVDTYLRGVAALGYVTASFSYDSTITGAQLADTSTFDCSHVTSTVRWAPIMQKAECMFDRSANGPHDGSGHNASALAQVCSWSDPANHVSADCSRGVVAMGHSQGGFLALTARNFDAAVQAAIGLSDTDKAHITGMYQGTNYDIHLDYANCLDDPGVNPLSVRALDRSRLLLFHGANDTLATLGSDTNPLEYIQAIVGPVTANCGASCLGSGGAGYYIVQSLDLDTPNADGHCWMYDSTTDCGPAASSQYAGLDPKWVTSTGTASAYTALTFLDQFVTPPSR